jgi:hypothetical protein
MRYHFSLIDRLETEGMTALGPALLVAVALASKAAGSKVVMCTDGLANLGIGSLDSSSSEIYSVASSFYSDVITLAKENRLACSLIITSLIITCFILFLFLPALPSL